MTASRAKTALVAAVFGLGLAALTGPAGVEAAEYAPTPPSQNWSFDGPFGAFDRGQLQRGFKVYREVCASCHGLEYMAFRNLAEPGGPEFTEAQAAQVASEYQIMDGPDESGEMFERPGRASDTFPSPFPNEQAARVANGGAYPLDLSVIAKARGGGADYLYALLMGYEDPPEDVELQPGQYWNAYFPGHAIGMPDPIADGQIEYTDGTPETEDQYSRDVTAFLMWVAEPKLEERKRMGFQTMAFLLVFGGLLWFTKRKVWSDIEH